MKDISGFQSLLRPRVLRSIGFISIFPPRVYLSDKSCAGKVTEPFSSRTFLALRSVFFCFFTRKLCLFARNNVSNPPTHTRSRDRNPSPEKREAGFLLLGTIWMSEWWCVCLGGRGKGGGGVVWGPITLEQIDLLALLGNFQCCFHCFFIFNLKYG